ncbi:MAG TPA: LCP family protein [Gaiellaceae bacterium]|nr:LCP family protein [Gaiellaceae bacterium]
MAASEEKPYRVYKGGRHKGKVPLPGRERQARREERSTYRGDGSRPRRRSSWTWKRWTWVTLLALVILLVIWSVAGYLSVRSGVSAANKRLPPSARSVLQKQNGLILSSPTNILLLGTDHAENGQAGRSSDHHSDSMMLLRTDPGRHRLVYLSIPRDLGVTIEGVYSKINSAMQLGGPKLAIKTVDNLFGSQLQINHVVIVDFGSFEKLINAVGGIDVNVPENILSNRFDCPYNTQARCQQWPGWRFHKGVQHLNGHQALIYSRVRENRLDPSWTDFKRSQSQQQVMQATLNKMASASMFFRLPFDGSSLLAPISTDLSTWDFLQLGWVKFRAGSTIHCRLGGSATGNGYITSTQENIQVVQEVLGHSAPQPPAPGTGLYGPGCVTGNQTFK